MRSEHAQGDVRVERPQVIGFEKKGDEILDYKEFFDSKSKECFELFATDIFFLLKKGVSKEEFMAAINPQTLLKEPFSSKASLTLMTRLWEVRGRMRGESGEELQSKDAESLLQSAVDFPPVGKQPESFYERKVGPATTRKLYVCPPLETADRFIKELYASLEAKQTPINKVKFNTPGLKIDGRKCIVGFGPSTFVVYCPSDAGVPQVLEAIAEAEKKSGIFLQNFETLPVRKSPLLLNGKVRSGGPDISQEDLRGQPDTPRSFDGWTKEVAQTAFYAFQPQDDWVLVERRWRKPIRERRQKSAPEVTKEGVIKVMLEKMKLYNVTPDTFLTIGI